MAERNDQHPQPHITRLQSDAADIAPRRSAAASSSVYALKSCSDRELTSRTTALLLAESAYNASTLPCGLVGYQVRVISTVAPPDLTSLWETS